MKDANNQKNDGPGFKDVLAGIKDTAASSWSSLPPTSQQWGKKGALIGAGFIVGSELVLAPLVATAKWKFLRLGGLVKPASYTEVAKSIPIFTVNTLLRSIKPAGSVGLFCGAVGVGLGFFANRGIQSKQIGKVDNSPNQNENHNFKS